ncbi:MAG: hypothetical protein R2822_27370 [Spirosomataceae bacterium]
MPPPTSTFTSSLNITIDGITMITRVNYLRINQRFENHHSFEVSVSPSMLSGQTDRLRNIADTTVGKRITINLSQSRSGEATQNNLFIGVVMAVRLVKGRAKLPVILLQERVLLCFYLLVQEHGLLQKKLYQNIVTPMIPPNWGMSSFTNNAVIPYVTQYEEDKFHFSSAFSRSVWRMVLLQW